MPHFLITSMPTIEIATRFEGQGNPAILVEAPDVSTLAEKLGAEGKPTRKRKIEDRKVEGLVWVVKLRQNMLVPFTQETQGLGDYWEDLVFDNEDTSQ